MTFPGANKANLSCIRHFAHLMGGSVVERSQNGSMKSGDFRDL